MSDFHMPDFWYEPPWPHDCALEDPLCDGTYCAERDADLRDDYLIAQDDADRGR